MLETVAYAAERPAAGKAYYTSRSKLAEACLAHSVGNGVVQAYQRSSMLERRHPVMRRWADFLTGEGAAKIVSIGSRRKRP